MLTMLMRVDDAVLLFLRLLLRQKDVLPDVFVGVLGRSELSSTNAGLRTRAAGQWLRAPRSSPRSQAAGLVRPQVPGQQQGGSV